MIYIKLDKTSKIPLYKQISAQIKELILTNVLAYDERLPFEKDLADLYNVSYIVVKNAYNLLKKKNLIKAIKGKGSYVTARDVYIGNYFDLLNILDPSDETTESLVLLFEEDVNDYDTPIYFPNNQNEKFAFFYQIILKGKRPICIQKFLYKESGLFNLKSYKASCLNLNNYLTSISNDIKTKVLYNSANSEKMVADLLLIEHKAPIVTWSALYSNEDGPFLYLKTTFPGQFFKMRAMI